ncbi:hypothetical protein QE443_003440 [Pantoea ananatis]|jgi:hypothetical protein|nr:hypothetical protein [Pantoea ananatis]MDR6092104.1 hypothetical protein [Pantoea ananatis]
MAKITSIGAKTKEEGFSAGQKTGGVTTGF